MPIFANFLINQKRSALLERVIAETVVEHIKQTQMNKKLTFLLFLVITIQFTFANDLDNEIIELGKIYRDFVFRSNPTDLTFKQLEGINSPELFTTRNFVKECITPNNNLTSEKFLKIPGEQTLLNLYLIMKVNANVREKEPKDNFELIRELRDKNVQRYELVENYYGMVFTGIGNKNQPFDLSKVNFIIDNYELRDETEKRYILFNSDGPLLPSNLGLYECC